jgi:hypothetical protein
MFLMTLFLAACSSTPSDKKADEFTKGQHFNELKDAKKDPPSKCTSFNTGNYCLWDEQILAFKDDIYQEIVSVPAETDKYKLAMDTLKNKDALDKTVYLKQWNKNADNNEWKRYSPLIKAVLLEQGFTVVEKPEDAQQMLRVSYGIQEMSGGNLRYLNLNSIDSRAYLSTKKESSFWKVKMSSWGTGRNLEKILPVMMVPFYSFLKNPETKVSNPEVDESSYEVIVFNHYFGIK